MISKVSCNSGQTEQSHETSLELSLALANTGSDQSEQDREMSLKL